jgi:predicted ATPase
VGCSVSALRKFEADELRPSKVLADLLAGTLGIAPEDRAAFVRFARDTPGDDTLRLLAQTVNLNHPPQPFALLSNLPTPATPLIGRETELAAVCDLLLRSNRRLLTLAGPGGTGKTHLALQAAADLRDAFRDGVFLVSLAAITDPNLVAPAIAQTLNVRETSGRTLLDNLHGYLRSKRMLLLLDNFEQVVTAAPMVAELLADAPALKVLATSRIPLHVRGEQEFAVLPLRLPDPKHPPALDQLARYGAVELFVQRARDVNPAFAVTAENAPAVIDICCRLDGLPLAIELAAAHSKIFSPSALLEQLGSRLAFLTGGARDAPARQQTLRATIEWSYVLLDGPDQTLFRRLAVFVGGFTLPAAVAVCNAIGDLEGDVAAWIESLVDKSMVRADPTRNQPRFFMLETLREYAVERLIASGEAEMVQRQHAQWFLALAEEAEPQLFFALRAHWLERLEHEHDNLRAALRWFVDHKAFAEGLRLGGALWPFWDARGFPTEGQMRLAELLSLSASGPHTVARAKVLLGAGTLTLALGNLALAESLLEESLGIGRAMGDSASVGWSQIRLGTIAYMRGQHAAASAYLEESLALWRAIGDQRGIAWALATLGIARRYQGDVTAARLLLEESVAIGRQIGDPYGIGWALFWLGQVLECQGDLENARVHEEESLAIWRELRDPRMIGHPILVLGRLALATDDARRACALWKEGLVITADAQDAWCIGCFLGSFTALAAAQQQPVRALRLAAATDRVFQTLGSPIPPATRALVEQGRVQAAQAVDPGTQASTGAEGRAMTLEQAVAYALEA